MAIWLGILLDGVPESLVIGTGLTSLVAMQEAAGGQPTLLDTVPCTLIAGLFLSNFPEALSSSVGMKEQGMASRYILGLWASLAAMTGLGAALGYAVGGSLSPVAVAGVEGTAAGAMLTMIAAAMLPEAAYRGGPVVSGAATMLGFGVALPHDRRGHASGGRIPGRPVVSGAANARVWSGDRVQAAGIGFSAYAWMRYHRSGTVWHWHRRGSSGLPALLRESLLSAADRVPGSFPGEFPAASSGG